MLYLKVIDQKGNIIVSAKGEEEVSCFCQREYVDGDQILLEKDTNDSFIWLQLDEALGRSIIYAKGNITYKIPFGKKRNNLSPKAFSGPQHLIYAKSAKNFEIAQYRNLSFNVNDHHQNTTYYPHVTANVETRGEAEFAAQNAIDGITINYSHGEWPFGSWGINRQEDAALHMDFGRAVKIDRIILYLRADFPHDNWWENVTFQFSDDSTLNAKLKKSNLGQEILFEPKTVKWLKLSHLVQSPDPSPFPALTQIEVYGMEAE